VFTLSYAGLRSARIQAFFENRIKPSAGWSVGIGVKILCEHLLFELYLQTGEKVPFVLSNQTE
jgi:hypothetical protein